MNGGSIYNLSKEKGEEGEEGRDWGSGGEKGVSE